MANQNDRNRLIIEEFRSNRGIVGGTYDGRPLLILSTSGAKTGRPHITPLMYLPDGDRWIIFGSKAGAPRHPDWYHNLVANPQVTLEVGTESFEAQATVLTGEERGQLYAKQVQLFPFFGDYERNTPREIPVIALTRRD